MPAGTAARAAAQAPARARQSRGAVDRCRAATALLAGRASAAALRRLRLGGGTSLPGLIVRSIAPSLTTDLAAQLRHGSIVVTGTNGKTSTSGLAAYVLRATGLRVWRNREGSNLARGVTAALMRHAALDGRLAEAGDAAFVFEVDEAAFSSVLAEVQPRVVAITNLFRDQLDRYGELDLIAERWRQAVRALPPAATLVLNADDPAVAALADARPDHAVLYFGVDDTMPMAEEGERLEVIDSRVCLRCQCPLTYARRFYSHVGHWRCPGCGFARPTPDVRARAIAFRGLDETRFTLVTPDGERPVILALPGLYNVYNALAAAAVGVAIGATASAASDGLGRFSPAFGRAERIALDGRAVRIFLAKNPTGMNEVMRMLAADGERHHVLLLLNDHVADGEDVSWIWDADFERMADLADSVTVGGRRAHDLALRLKYAGVAVDGLAADIGAALAHALERVPVGELLCVLPTYTAMLAVRSGLERQGHLPTYWEQSDG
jgi:lipid II isoglutaminyl synthase (glutamine-hydrolysing)